MIVLGADSIDEFGRSHADARDQLSAWLHEARDAEWRTPGDIKARYAHASFLRGNRVVFNICGNKYRIDTEISYKIGVVRVIRIGTHAEYDTWRF